MRNKCVTNHVMKRDSKYYYVRIISKDLTQHYSIQRLFFSLWSLRIIGQGYGKDYELSVLGKWVKEIIPKIKILNSLRIFLFMLFNKYSLIILR